MSVTESCGIIQGRSDVTYFLEAASDVTISNLTSCAGELNIHLQDFDNWGRPIIPPVQGCPDVVYDPDKFFDDSTGSNWVCLTKGDDLVVADYH